MLKLMQLFYADKDARLHLREIARQTKLHEPSMSRFLGSLEKDQI
jgi:DNA-binding IclR family transcriptional regulator